MPNIYLKVTIEKNMKKLTFSKIRFSMFNKFVTRSVLGSSNSRRCWILKLLVATKKLEVWEQNCAWLFCYFNFERNYNVLKSKSPCILFNKNKNFNKNESYRKWKIPHTILERRTLRFSSYKNRKLKVKLWWVRAPERKKGHFLYYLFCPK